MKKTNKRLTLAEAPDILTVDQVAEILAVNPQIIYELNKSGELNGFRIRTKMIRFTKEDIKKFIYQDSFSDNSNSSYSENFME